VTGSSVRLRRRPRIANQSQPLLYADIRPGDPGAVVECRLVAAHVVVRALTAWFFGFMVVVLLAAVAMAVAGPEQARSSIWQGVLLLVVLLLFCACGLWFLRFLVRGEAASLKRFVTETLEAAPQDAGVTKAVGPEAGPPGTG
jgi:hypothetical protein